MEGTDRSIKEEIERLIRESCNFEVRPTLDYQRFHKVFLKFYFGVLDVEVQYEKHTILTRDSKPHSPHPLTVDNVSDALIEVVNYVSLEETLLGCLREGTSNERFYAYLLKEFHRFSREGRTA